jgi:cyclic pyranopterin phosphate synthase
MPEEGIDLSPEGKILTNKELLRLASLFVRNGVTKIRLTGGEPTIRKGIVDLIGKRLWAPARGDTNKFDLTGRFNELKSLGLKSIAMTSNGLALHRKLPQMIDSGLSHLNLRCAFWSP